METCRPCHRVRAWYSIRFLVWYWILTGQWMPVARIRQYVATNYCYHWVWRVAHRR